MALILPHSIFIHIPKTGGSWVRRAIKLAGIHTQEVGPCQLGRIQVLHASIRQVPREYRRGRQAFAFIRHPVSWLKSKWAYAIKRGKLKRRTTSTDKCLHRDLNVFLERLLERNAALPTHSMMHRIGWARVGSQWKNTLKRKMLVGKNESLHTDLIRFLKQAGESFNPEKMLSLKPVRVAGKKSKQEVSPELASRICDANQILMELGGY